MCLMAIEQKTSSTFWLVFHLTCCLPTLLPRQTRWGTDLTAYYRTIKQAVLGYTVAVTLWVIWLISIDILTDHHHHVLPPARISLILSRHVSLLFIASAWSSGLVSSRSCWMYIRAGRPAFARSYVGVHRSTSLMSSSLLLQQCPACLLRLTWIVFVMRVRWSYS